ncbi:MAG: hypothetical protein ABI871_05385 [Chthoniobacterales bacterium]
MNQPLLLHIVQRLEGFLTKLPATIQKPILHELTPLKELFLQQRPPRFLLTGSNKSPAQEIVSALFASAAPSLHDVLTEVYRWQEVEIAELGKIMLLDARGMDAKSQSIVQGELQREPGDLFFHLEETGAKIATRTRDLSALVALCERNAVANVSPRIIGVVLLKSAARVDSPGINCEPVSSARAAGSSKLEAAIREQPGLADRLLQVVEIVIGAEQANMSPESQRLMSLLATELPNQARVEMIRISRDRAAQARIAQVVVKSTSAICTAIGAQPIPLADLPILTTLQLVMVSGVMYVSGRERSLRAATEFLAALGANVGAGMLLREGARAVLKFFPGWGNVVCGMVAGAGTYAIGKAAIVYFIEGVSLKDARRTYLANRKKPLRQKMPRKALPDRVARP